ncbi:single-stranded-DNA-specific exonuclease RecJ [Parvibaculum sp.]|uniref:single-stranded-DNA-specific exonuclease RecJ n=1 Tax=Parvibaculum sp. TaxID=2024848 RepID=UPI00272F570A|nr:single-stranded-DNA-specific exonuclease RecJ [Parvibaculum sp.]MDP1628221.1 single-stranded-DNA-specific exonuclease RecJ [Parvibaculum sp.]MDP2148061.1 single-stranded-DNA-specific exonuclease RecJ [Parvibaculum sp.]MDP3330351.1 single-stranded-DNA-specific exonuclease RecJ [Parvibaculum sp.]
MLTASTRAFLGVDRSATGRAWVSRLADDRLALAIAQREGLPEIVARVLAGRGVAPEDCAAYLAPSIKTLMPDPRVVTDMEKAATRVAQAIMAGEKIAVFGDYDVDGATSSALLQRFFRAAGSELRIYIPDRIREGYGPNAPALLRLKQEGIGLVITVDCGTMAHKALGLAADAGLPSIVVDHHQAEPALPPAYALVNPNRLDDDSGLGQLAAVGVAFLFVVATNRALREAGWYATRPEPDLMQWLDLVALGTICDVVPLAGLNRAFVVQGLRVMARRQNIGLAALSDVARMNGAPVPYHCGFLLGPRVNAGGRVGKADLGARLLTTENAEEARAIAEELNVMNAERQAIEAQVLEEALAQVDARLAAARANALPPIIVASGRGWHPGVIGIVASRLKDKYERPSLVLAFDEKGEGKGSGRSLTGVDLGRAVTAALEAGLLVNGGGHAMAAGLTLREDKLDALEDFLAKRLADDVAVASEARALKLDGALSARGATRELYELLQQAGPYGAGNAEPRFAMPSVRVVKADVVGKDHVRCILTGEDGGRIKAIAFRAATTPLGAVLMDRGSGLLHVAGRLSADDWQNRRDVQLTIEDAVPTRDAAP